MRCEKYGMHHEYKGSIETGKCIFCIEEETRMAIIDRMIALEYKFAALEAKYEELYKYVDRVANIVHGVED